MTTAITYGRFGGPEVLEVSEVDPPEPGPGEVQLEVRAAGVNLVDAKLRRGDLAHVFTPQFPVIPGIEVAGVVTALGGGVEGVTQGDEVFGVAAYGGYTQLAVASHFELKPESVSWELAAALPTVGEAAFRTLAHLEVRAGERLLIQGAAGSVGTIATQLALARGLTVIGVARDDDLELLRRRGALAVEYGPGLVARVRELFPDGVDAVLDTSGAGVLRESIELAGGPERVITLADESAQGLGVRFTGPDPTDRDRTALAKLADLAATGSLELSIWHTYALSAARQAHADLDDGRNRGKIVLLPEPLSRGFAGRY
jgi:NADPH:quinone reductase-like Zn-dependent oxidoreductase